MTQYLDLLMFAALVAAILTGFPVSFSIAGVAIIFGYLGWALGVMDITLLGATGQRIFGLLSNQVLIAIPLFVLMGAILEKSRIAEELLDTMGRLFGSLKGGLGISVVLVGALLAASTGIVGATVVAMGMIALPTMLRTGYDPRVASGIVCTAGTLGQIIPPSTLLIILADVMSNAYQQAQYAQGKFAIEAISVGQFFAAAIVPGLVLVLLYLVYILLRGLIRPQDMPPALQTQRPTRSEILSTIIPPVLLIVAVLGSIFFGIATPTEAGVIGAVGAMVLAALNGGFSRQQLSNVCESTMRTTAMVMAILMGSTAFSLVFRGVGGDQLISDLLLNLPGGRVGFLVFSMLIIFLLGFFIDFFEIAFIAVPLLLPAARQLLGPEALVWFGVMIGANLQTSFLTPPFGFALFFLRGVAPDEVSTRDIYRGALPFVGLQVAVLALIIAVPGLVDWLPRVAGALSPGPMT